MTSLSSTTVTERRSGRQPKQASFLLGRASEIGKMRLRRLGDLDSRQVGWWRLDRRGIVGVLERTSVTRQVVSTANWAWSFDSAKEQT